MSKTLVRLTLARGLLLGVWCMAGCHDRANEPRSNAETMHTSGGMPTCSCPNSPESTPPSETKPSENTAGQSAGTAAGAAPDASTAGDTGGTPTTPVVEPFAAPATATPVDDYKVDHGLTSFQSVVLKFDDVVTLDRYNWQSKYLNFETWDLDNSPDVVPSERCVIEYKFKFGTHCFPITLGNYALEKYSKYVAGTPDAIEARNRFLEAADWFVENQDENGGWGAEYAHNFWTERAAILPVGWYSGMAQGLAISVLVRAFFLQDDPSYLDAARRAVGVMRTPVEQGGVKRCVDGHTFYEEYPTTPMSNVLNGYLFAVIGLYDLAQLTTEPVYDAYFDEAVATVKAIISHYDLGFATSYDLSHLQNPGAYPNRARWGYHTLHVMQLSLLRAVTKDEFFTPVIDRWTGYVDGTTVPEN